MCVCVYVCVRVCVCVYAHTRAHAQVLFCKLDGKRWSDHAKTFGLSGKTPGIVLEDRTVTGRASERSAS